MALPSIVQDAIDVNHSQFLCEDSRSECAQKLDEACVM